LTAQETDVGVGSAEGAIPELNDVVVPAIHASVKEDGWALLATVGWYIVNNNPSFDSRNYGHPRLGSLVRSLSFVEVKEALDANGSVQLWVRLRHDVGG
jgi:hypothetical protein